MAAVLQCLGFQGAVLRNIVLLSGGPVFFSRSDDNFMEVFLIYCNAGDGPELVSSSRTR
jgi:hypothetical protein